MIFDISDCTEDDFAFLSDPSVLRAWYEKKSDAVLGMLCSKDDYPGDLYQVGRDLYVPKLEFDLLFGGERGLVSLWMVVNSVYGGPYEAEALEKLAKFLSSGGAIVSQGISDACFDSVDEDR